MIIFNVLGLVWWILAIGLALASQSLFGQLPANKTLLLIGSFLLLLDGLHRYCSLRPKLIAESTLAGGEKQILQTHSSLVWFLNGAGGTIFFIPIWIWGVVVILMGTVV
jgi:hypothetical protein